jgi:hypothetical protein
MKLNRYNQFLKENNQFNYNSVDDFLATSGTHWGLILNYSSNNISAVKYIGKFEGDNYEQITTNHQDWLSYLREDFAESIKNCAMGRSYSDLCKKKDDPDKDFELIQKEIEEDCGWNMQSIQNLFSQEINALTFQQFQDFINSYGLDNQNGLVDIYLYKLAEKLGHDPNIVELGGGGWCEYVTDDEEVLIRYSYGYHHTKYGELMLKQAGVLREDFVERSLNSLKSKIIEDIDFEGIDMENFFMVDFDRLIISVNDLLEEIHNSDVGQIYFTEMNREDLIAKIAKSLSDNGVKLKFKDTGNEIILLDEVL